MGEQKKIRYKDIRFVYMASTGAMGGSDCAAIVTQGKTGAVWHHFNTRIKKEEKAFLEAFPPVKEHGAAFVLDAPPPWHSVDITAGHTVAGFGRAGALFEYACNQHFEERDKAWRKDPHAHFPSFDWMKQIDEILALMAENGWA
jgi:hypothetical protein